MAKTTVSAWDTTAANNTDINSIDITGTTGLVKNGDNAIREMMAQIKAGVPYLSSTSIVVPSGTAALVADADDGATLGTTAVQWSDLFLASGGVINWANGDVTATHSSNALAFAGASSGYSFDAVIIASAGLKSQPRVKSEASNATPATDADSYDLHCITAAAANMTIGSPTGTPANGQKLMYRIKDNGTARTIGWNAIFRAVNVSLPATTVISKTMYVGAQYNSSDSKWDVIAVALEA